MNTVDSTLLKLARLIRDGRFEPLETDALEIKPVPAQGGEWKEICKSVNAFLNTRGGVLILGVKEEEIKEEKSNRKRYVHKGWQADKEPNLKEISKNFTDRNGHKVDLSDCFPPMELKPFLTGHVALVYVDELAADRKYVFFEKKAYRRNLTGDHVISESEIELQEEYREEAQNARELLPVPGVQLKDIDLDKLNEYIQELNRAVKTETIKANIKSATSFLARKQFIKENKVTTLGVLVCGKHPEDHLGFRCQVHGYVDVPQQIAQDKQDFADNILPLMQASLSFILRNIQVGVSVTAGGQNEPQYPEELLRETVNNALAHRDYSIDRQVIIAIKPGVHIEIQNPGAFRKYLLLEFPKDPIPLRRIIPEAKPRNPKLANVLREFRKWEGRGIGMATLVNLCLDDRIDLPYYKFKTEEVRLFLRAGKLLDERMRRLFQSFDGYLERKMRGNPLSEPQQRVLAYLIKSEWANQKLRYTILLTSDNNHFDELNSLKKHGLIHEHPESAGHYPVYVVDRALVKNDYLQELRDLFGLFFDALDPFLKDILGVVWRYEHFSNNRLVSAKMTSFYLWYEREHGGDNIEKFDSFYRKIRRAFNSLERSGFIKKNKIASGYGYSLNMEYKATHLA
jgi:ATP-dependent DNA helicase RecG